jgi:hypothetical protein
VSAPGPCTGYGSWHEGVPRACRWRAEALPYIAARLDDPSPCVRFAAVLTLGAFGVARFGAATRLGQCLTDPDLRVRAACPDTGGARSHGDPAAGAVDVGPSK